MHRATIFPISIKNITFYTLNVKHYFTVLATADLALSVTFFIGGLTRGALHSSEWIAYDALIGLPLGGTINSMQVMATVCVTVGNKFILIYQTYGKNKL